MNKIKIAIVDDDSVWQNAMRDFLNNFSDLSVIALASNREEALALKDNLDIDVILMDINLTGNNMDGIYVVNELSKLTKAKIIMLTSYEDENVIKDAFIAGAVNYIPKSDYTKLPDIIKCVFNHKNPIEAVLKDYWKLKEHEFLNVLSPSEKKIISLVEEGYTHAQISEKLYKSQGTIKSQINKILKKTNAKSVKEVIKKIKSKGLVEK